MKTKYILLPILAALPLCFGTMNAGNESISTYAFNLNHESKEFVRNLNVNKGKNIKNVICFIGDGMGYNHVNAGGIYLGKPLTFANPSNEKWTYHALVNTDSLTSEGFTLDESKSLIKPDLNATLYDGTPSPYGGSASFENITPYTDSAAGGTAIATGKKVTNSRVAMDIEGNYIETIVEIAHKLGKKTGVVTSDYITGATPADFISHVPNRYNADSIITQGATSGVDLLIGEKPGEWDSDHINEYQNAGFSVCYDTKGLTKNKDKIICLPDDIAALDNYRCPTLTELTEFSLDFLDNEEGFFLMVEGAKIDKRSHEKNAYGTMRELEGFNNAVYEAEKWASLRDDTLILVTADHECGAMYYDYAKSTQATILEDMKFLSYNHSRARIRLDVFGDISEFTSKYASEFNTLEGMPYWDNTYTFNLMCSYL